MTTKTVYSFDPNTLSFLGPLLLDESDLSPLDLAEGREVWCVPGNTLEVAPPKDVPAGMYAAAVDGAWEIRKVPMQPGAAAPAAGIPTNRVLSSMEAGAMLHATVQKHLDAIARTQRFDSIAEAVSYFSSPIVKYMAQAMAFVKLRDTTWAMIEPIVDDVSAGLIAAPKFAELMPTLPIYDAVGVDAMIEQLSPKKSDEPEPAPAAPSNIPAAPAITQEAVDAANAAIEASAATRKTTKKKA